MPSIELQGLIRRLLALPAREQEAFVDLDSSPLLFIGSLFLLILFSTAWELVFDMRVCHEGATTILSYHFWLRSLLCFAVVLQYLSFLLCDQLS